MQSAGDLRNAGFPVVDRLQAVCENSEGTAVDPETRAASSTAWKEGTMIAQLLITESFNGYMQALYAMCRRFLTRQVGALMAVILASAVCPCPSSADDYDIIIEKNLFHDKRQKWEMEKSQAKGASSQAGSQDRPSIDTINLFGTVIRDSESYAVMRVSEPAAKSAASRRALLRARRASRTNDKAIPGAQGTSLNQDNKRPYAVGDFINGYQVVGIQSESVLLQYPNDNKSYEIFMNEGQAERIEVRTEIPEDKAEKPTKAAGKERKPPGRSKAPSSASQNKASETDALRKRFERDLQRLRNEKNDDVSRKAERDLQKFESMMSSLDGEGQEELERLKSEFEKLRQ